MDPEVLLEALAVEQELWPFCVAVQLCRKSTEENLQQPAPSRWRKLQPGHVNCSFIQDEGNAKNIPSIRLKKLITQYHFPFNTNKVFKDNNTAILELTELL